MTAEPSLRFARSTFGDRLSAAAAELALPLSSAQADRLLDFIELLDRWNHTYNLTAVRDPADMLTQHLVDCLAAVPPLRRKAPGRRLLDVGSGGGLPGIVWAILDPDREVTCVDSVGKKAAFVQQAALALRLGNLRSEHARVERLRAGTFDVVSSRAFASLPDFAALTPETLEGRWNLAGDEGKSPAGRDCRARRCDRGVSRGTLEGAGPGRRALPDLDEKSDTRRDPRREYALAIMPI